MSALEIDVFWSFRRPWSYLATPRLRALQAEWDLAVNFRPVYPIAVRTPEFFLNASPMWAPYLMLDVHRCAEFLGLPFKWPSPDPVAQYRGDDGKPRTADEQPYIARLTRLGVVAQEQGRGIEFADEISKAIWTGHENWHEGDHLARATEKAGLNLAAMDALVESDTERLEAMIAKNQEDHTRAGHWGVPTCAFEGEPFFGQDRLDVLVWRLKKAGLQARSNARA